MRMVMNGDLRHATPHPALPRFLVTGQTSGTNFLSQPIGLESCHHDKLKGVLG
jgi:hypothetical protein